MTKTQLIDQAAKASGMTKKELTQAYDALMGAVEGALLAGESVQLSGFGIFAVKEQAARTGRNPKTGEAVTIAASRRATFSASKTLKDKLNG